jgi:hypothetical protein
MDREREITDVEMAEFAVPLPQLADRCNPLDGHEWDCDPIDPADVIDAADHQEFEQEHWQAVNQRHRGTPFDDVTFHIRRMAFLYASVDNKPIELEVERFEGKVSLRVFDGNHRLGSAIIRGDADICVLVPCDDIGDFLAIFPSALATTSSTESRATAAFAP